MALFALPPVGAGASWGGGRLNSLHWSDGGGDSKRLPAATAVKRSSRTAEMDPPIGLFVSTILSNLMRAAGRSGRTKFLKQILLGRLRWQLETSYTQGEALTHSNSFYMEKFELTWR